MLFLVKRKIKSLRKKITALCIQRQKQQSEPAATVDEGALAKEIALNLKLAKNYEKLRYNKKFANAELLAMECYRNAGSLGDESSLHKFGNYLLEKAKFWQARSKETYGCSIHSKYAKFSYEEAFQYIIAAEDRGYLVRRGDGPGIYPRGRGAS